MKTTLEIPDTIFRRAKSKTAEQGIPLRRSKPTLFRPASLLRGGRPAQRGISPCLCYCLFASMSGTDIVT